MSGVHADAANPSAATARPAESGANVAPLASDARDAAASNEPSPASNGGQEAKLSTADGSVDAPSENTDVEPSTEPPTVDTELQTVVEARYDEDEETESEMEMEIDEVDEEEAEQEVAAEKATPLESQELENRAEADAQPTPTDVLLSQTTASEIATPPEVESKASEPETEEEEEDEAFPVQQPVSKEAEEKEAVAETAEAKQVTMDATEVVAEAKEATTTFTQEVADAKEPTMKEIEEVAEAKGSTAKVTEGVEETKKPVAKVTEEVAEAKGPTTKVTVEVAEAKGPATKATEEVAEAKESATKAAEVVEEAKEPTTKGTEEVASAKGSMAEVSKGKGETEEPTKTKDDEKRKPEEELHQQQRRGDVGGDDEEDRPLVRSLTMVEVEADGELLRVLEAESSRMAVAERKMVVWNDIAKRFPHRFKAGRNVQARVAWLQLVSRDKEHRQYGKLTDEMKNHIETYAEAMSLGKNHRMNPKKRVDVVSVDSPRPVKTARIEQAKVAKSPVKGVTPASKPTKDKAPVILDRGFPPAPLNLHKATLNAAIEEQAMLIVLKYAHEFHTTERNKVWDRIARASPGRYESGRQAKHHVLWLVNVLKNPAHPEHKKITPALRKVVSDFLGSAEDDTPAKSEKSSQPGKPSKIASERQQGKGLHKDLSVSASNKHETGSHPSPKPDAKKGKGEHFSPKRGDVVSNGTPKKVVRITIRPISDEKLVRLVLSKRPYTASSTTALSIWKAIARSLGANHPDVNDSHSASQRFNTLVKVFNDPNHPNHEDLSLALMEKLSEYDEIMKSFRAKLRLLKEKAENDDVSEASGDENAKSNGGSSVKTKAGTDNIPPALSAPLSQPSQSDAEKPKGGIGNSRPSSSAPNPVVQATLVPEVDERVHTLSTKSKPLADISAKPTASSTVSHSTTIGSKPPKVQKSTTMPNASLDQPSNTGLEKSEKKPTTPKTQPTVDVKSPKFSLADEGITISNPALWLPAGVRRTPLPLDVEADELLMRAMLDIQPWKAERHDKSEAWARVVNTVKDKNPRIRNGVGVMGRVKWLQRVLETPEHEDHSKLTNPLRESLTKYTQLYNNYRDGGPQPISVKAPSHLSGEEFVGQTDKKKRKAPESVDSSAAKVGGSTPKAKRVASPRDLLAVKAETVAFGEKKSDANGVKQPASSEKNAHDVLLREALRARPFHGDGDDGMGSWDKVAISADRILGHPIYKTGVHAMKRVQRLLSAFRSRGDTSDIRLTAQQSEMLALIDSMLKVKWPTLGKRLTDEHNDLIARADELVNGTSSADNVSVEALKSASSKPISENNDVAIVPTEESTKDASAEEDDEPEMRIVIRSEEERRQLKIQAKLRRKLELAEKSCRELEAQLEQRKGLEAEIKLRLDQVNALQDEVVKLRAAAASDRSTFEAQNKSLHVELASYNLALGKQTVKLEQEREEHRAELRSIVEMLKTEREMHERDTRTLLEVVHREREDRREEFVAMMNLVTRSVLQGELVSGE